MKLQLGARFFGDNRIMKGEVPDVSLVLLEAFLDMLSGVMFTLIYTHRSRLECTSLLQKRLID